MAVDSPSDFYNQMMDRWQTCRDCVEGTHAIKANGTRYLPALEGHNPRDPNDDYWKYVKRALFFAGTGRTIQGLVGMVFRRPPIIKAPEGSEDLLSDVDLMGRSLEEFAKALLRELLTVGRAAVLVDHTRPPAEPRPYMRLYRAEEILDVIEDVSGGAVVPIQARLREVFEQPSGDTEFDTEVVEQIRVLEIVEGRYRQRLFRRINTDTLRATPMAEVEVIEPTIDTDPISTMPLWVFSVDEGGRPKAIEPPPLIDLAEVNLAHYRQEADYRNALHMAGVPTMAISGMEKPANPIKVGTAEAMWMPPPDAKAYYVSYGAEGAAAIRQSLDDLLEMMSLLGARMLQTEKKGVEAADTARIHRAGEISILGSIANGINTQLTRALQFMLTWAAYADVDDAKIALNDDFMPTQAPPQLLAEMLKSWQAGGISFDSWWRFNQEGELVDPRRTAEEELKLIEDEKPEQDHLTLEQQQLQTERQRIEVRALAREVQEPVEEEED